MKNKEKEKLEHGINYYVDNWFDGLIKSWKIEANKEALKTSYKWVAKQAVKAYLEDSGEATQTTNKAK